MLSANDKTRPKEPGSEGRTGDVICRRVKLAPFDPGLPSRRTVFAPDSQCDCACFAVESEALPVLQSPVSFYLELTPQCNNRCPSCGNVFVERGSRSGLTSALSALSATEWGQILSAVQPHAQRLKLTGGEPTLHPEFESIVREIGGLDIPFTLFTNACWQTPQKLCSLLKSIPSLEGLLVSLHGPNSASHEAVTNVSGSFAGTIANTQLAIDRGLPASLSCIITSLNWNRIEEMLNLAEKLGVESVVFNRYLGPDTAALAASPGELYAAVETISGLRASGAPVKLGNCLPECFAPSDQAGCLAGLAFFTIDPWGRVRPCNHAELICGNILEQSVAEIWESASMAWWRSFDPEPCQTCSALVRCRGGCKAQALSSRSDADPLMSTPLHSPSPPRRQWVFYDQARPLGRFDRHLEQFGNLLVCGNRLMPVSHDLLPILDELDGRATLRQIEGAYGSPGLELLASLYEQGMVEFRTCPQSAGA